jgi:hypothetical protein
MKPYRKHLIVVGLYTLLTLALTWPWAANFTTAFPGSQTWAFDESTFIWNIWRFKHNILDLRQSPLYTTDIFWPLGISLVLYTYNFLNALLGLPLLLGFNLPLASNMTLLFAYVFSGYGCYLLLVYLLREQKQNSLRLHLAAFVGGASYAFLASRAIFAALGHYDIVSTEFIPFFTLFFIKSLREPGLKNPILAGIFAALCLLAEMIFGVFLLFLGLILFAYHLKPTARRKPAAYLLDNSLDILERSSPRLYHLLALTPRLLILGLTIALLWGPVMLPILRAFTQGDFDLSGWGESLKLSADLVGWFTPTDLHPLWGSDWPQRLRQVQEGTAPFSDVNTVFLGYGLLVLALIGALTAYRRAKMWLAGAVVFAVFTLGPLLQIRGRFLFPLDNLLREQNIPQDITFPLPFALLHYIPIIRANRVPARFSVVLGLALAVLASYGAFWLLGKIKGSRPILITATGLLVMFALFDQLALPMPLTSARVPEVYRDIGAEAGDFALMQLPLGWRNSFGVFGAERTQLQYYQHIHRKPMIGGNISRAPEFKFDYYRRIPLFQAFARTQLPQSDPAVDPDTLAQAKAQAADLMTLYNVGYLVIHDPIPGRKPYEDTFLATRDLAFELLPLDPEPAYTAPGVAAYKVNQPPIPEVLHLDFGAWPADPYRGEGWGNNEVVAGASANWVVGSEALIFFPYQGEGKRQMTMHLTPFTYPAAPPQTLTLILNDRPLASRPLEGGWQVFEMTLPAEHLQPGLNRLKLRFSQQAVPREVLPAQTAIGRTGAHVPRDIEINSQPDFSFVTVGFGDEAVDASTHRRGFNLAVLDPATGEVLDMRGFDTAANVYEAQALTDYIAQIPPGQLVIVSSQGADAAALLTGGFEALGGSPGIPTIPYSLIGLKGAPPGTAAEATDDAYLRLGANPDTRPLSAAVDWLEIHKDQP